MVKIKINYEETKMIATWNATEEWLDSLTDITKHITTYGFLFNEFRLIFGDNFLQYKVEIDRDVFNVIKIKFNEGIKEEYIFSYYDYLESMVNLLNKKVSMEDFKSSEINECLLLINFVTYVIYKSLHQEQILVEQTQRKYTGSRSSKGTPKTVYSLTECVRKYARHINHCKHVITCDHWEVRGHFRHLKSGKVVYVRPFTKGKNKDVKPKERTYKL